MKLIDPLIEVEKYDGLKIMKNIERACRTCYRSEGLITDTSYKGLIKGCISRGHESVLEHEKITVRITADIGSYKDLTRHRFGSFSVESTRYCVAGNTNLKFANVHNKYTVAELYNLIQSSKNGQWKRMKIKQLNEDTGIFEYGLIKNIYKNGKKKCFKIKTDLQYELICTGDHSIYTPNGYKKLEELDIGDLIYVNGNTVSEPLYQDYNWLYNQYVTLDKSYNEIAMEFGYICSTVKKWGHKLGMPFKGSGYKNINKEPWNKGLTESDDLRVKNQVNAIRKNRYNRWEADTYETAPNGDVILEATPRVYRKYRKDYCEICGRKNCKLEVHHKDGNHNNFDESNFITLCPKCHQGVENKSLNILLADKIISIECVGDYDVYDVEMNSKYHNFIANGVVVHNCNYGKDKFDNEIKIIKPCHIEEGTNIYTDWYSAMQHMESFYMRMVDNGAKPDQLRMILPHSTAAQYTMTANIREWRHILDLRTKVMTHPSIRQVLIPLLLKFQADMPELFDSIEYDTTFDPNKYAVIKDIED